MREPRYLLISVTTFCLWHWVAEVENYEICPTSLVADVQDAETEPGAHDSLVCCLEMKRVRAVPSALLPNLDPPRTHPNEVEGTPICRAQHVGRVRSGRIQIREEGGRNGTDTRNLQAANE